MMSDYAPHRDIETRPSKVAATYVRIWAILAVLLSYDMPKLGLDWRHQVYRVLKKRMYVTTLYFYVILKSKLWLYE